MPRTWPGRGGHGGLPLGPIGSPLRRLIIETRGARLELPRVKRAERNWYWKHLRDESVISVSSSFSRVVKLCT